jgi:hypothetical protein
MLIMVMNPHPPKFCTIIMLLFRSIAVCALVLYFRRKNGLNICVS